MDNAKKKDLIRDYKEQKATPGIFAVRCSDQVWIGPSKNLEKQQNSVWFQLRQNGHMNKAMQAAWNKDSGAGFTFEIVEEIADDNPQMIALILKERDAHWRETLGAGRAL